MSTLAALLPRPKHAKQQRDESRGKNRHKSTSSAAAAIPPYGQRGGFVPKALEDFGDGGAYPECHVVQYPLDMGNPEAENADEGKQVVQVTVGADGKVNYDAILRQGMREEQHLQSKLTDMIEKDVAKDDLQRPDEEELRKTTERTAAALGQLVEKSVQQRQFGVNRVQAVDSKPVFVRYTPNQAAINRKHNSGASQRIVRVQQRAVDPLEPPKFKHKRLPGAPPSPPVPVLHSPPRKVTAQDQANWDIPPCISNWKNSKGFTIALDKRMAADGRGLQQTQINSKFANVAEALYLAEQSAREEIKARAKMEASVQHKQKLAKEEELRELARRAREAGTGLAGRAESDDDDDAAGEGDEEEEERQGKKKSQGIAARAESDDDSDDDDERRKRDELRKEREREIRRQMRMEAKRKERDEKLGRRARQGERDVSEKIALGQHVAKSHDSQFDQRLFNQDAGLDSGFGADDSYDLYSKPLFQTNTANYVYRPKANAGADVDDAQAASNVSSLLEKSSGRFRPDRGFEGTDDPDAPARSERSEPVQFEKSVQEEDDPFGMSGFLSNSKRKILSDDSKNGKFKGSGYMSAAGGGGGSASASSSRRMDFAEGSAPPTSLSSGAKPGLSVPASSSTSSSSSSSSKRKDRHDDGEDRHRKKRLKRHGRSHSRSRSRSRDRHRDRHRRRSRRSRSRSHDRHRRRRH